MMYAATMTGRPRSLRLVDRASPMPEARRTAPNIPPAPVMRMTDATGPSAESTTFSSAVPFSPRRKPNTTVATSTVMSRATGELPSRTSTCTRVLFLSTAPAALRVVRPVLRKMRSIGSSSTAMTVIGFGGLAG